MWSTDRSNRISPRRSLRATETGVPESRPSGRYVWRELCDSGGLPEPDFRIRSVSTRFVASSGRSGSGCTRGLDISSTSCDKVLTPVQRPIRRPPQRSRQRRAPKHPNPLPSTAPRATLAHYGPWHVFEPSSSCEAKSRAGRSGRRRRTGVPGHRPGTDARPRHPRTRLSRRTEPVAPAPID